MRAAAAIVLLTLTTAAVSKAPTARADEVDVAVAANFAGPMERIARDFEKDTGNHVVIASGATGTLFAQIERGAPFDVLFAADEATPKRLEDDGFAVVGSRFTYAVGRLVLWSAKEDDAGAGALRNHGDEVLKQGTFHHLAIANPKIAPYGAAAIAVLDALKVLAAIRPKLVQGESVAQAFQFVASGNAELGFVALSQVVQGVRADAAAPGGSYWVVPPELYPPLKQDAALLRRAQTGQTGARASARAFCEYVRKPKARDMIRAYGYGLTP